jgi:hypothetical protein
LRKLHACLNAESHRQQSQSWYLALQAACLLRCMTAIGRTTRRCLHSRDKASGYSTSRCARNWKCGGNGVSASYVRKKDDLTLPRLLPSMIERSHIRALQVAWYTPRDVCSYNPAVQAILHSFSSSRIF